MSKLKISRVLKKIRLRTYIALGLLFILTPLVVFSLFKPQSSNATWMNDAWAYRVKVPVTAHTGAETNVYFTKTVDTSDTTKFQSDCGDIRFTDLNGKFLPYYIASGCSSASTVIHVLVSTFPAGATDYYMYYGNPSAVNGFSSADFTAGTGVTVGSVGSEEKSIAPVASWSFDEGNGTTTRDLTGNGNTGTLTNMASPGNGTSGWLSEDACVTGRCLSFDGTSDYVTVPDSNSLDLTTSFSIASWVNLRSDGGGGEVAIVNKGRDATATYAYQLGLEGGRFYFKLYDGTNNPIPSADVVPTYGKWYYVVATYDGSTMKIYVNGKLSGTQAYSINIGNQTGPLVIGKNANASDRYFPGKIDDVRLYKYPLSAAQVLSNYNSRLSDDGAGTAIGNSTQTSLATSLVAYWKMDETAANGCEGGTNDSCDSAGFGADGAWNGDAGPTPGKFGNGVSFDGTGDYITASGTLSSNNPVTLAAWINPTTTTGRVEIVDTSPFNFLNLQSGKLCFYDGDVNNAYFCSSASISTNTWTHVLGTYDPNTNTEKLYINGVLDSSFVPSGTPSSGSVDTSIGACGGCGYSNLFTGKIDEVRIYQKAFTQVDVNALYRWVPGPVGYWKMDEKTGTTAADSSGNGLNGTLTNGPFWTAGKYGSGIGTSIANSSHQNITVSDNSLLDFSNTQDYTTSIWFRASAFSNSLIQPLVKSYYIQIDTNQNRCVYDADGVIGGSGIIDNQWHYVTCVMDRDGRETGVAGLSLYIDGKYMGSDTTLTGTDQSGSSASLTFGETSWDMDGAVDEAKIYNYARTPQQIVEDMNGGHPTGGSPVGSYVSYWRMDEANGTTAHDYNNTNANSLTLSTSSWDLSGKTNSAWKGVGTNWLSRTDDDDFDLAAAESGSISMWFKSTSATNPGATEYLFAKGRGSPPGYALYFNTSGFLCFSIDDDASWTPDDTACTTNDLYDGTWHHVIAEKKGTTELRLYVDGNSRATDTSIAATGSLENSGSLYVGDDDGDNTNSFNGDIDEVKFYKSALTQDQVLFDYNSGASINFGSTASTTEAAQLSDGAGNAPVGWWSFDEKTGTTVADKSGDGINATITDGGTIGNWTTGKYGSAYNLKGGDGADVDKINFGGSSISLGTSNTISFWANFNNINTNGATVGTSNEVSCGTLCGYMAYFDNAGNIYSRQETGSAVSVSTGTIAMGTWYHFEIVRSGTSVTFYKNGVKLGATQTLGANNAFTLYTLSNFRTAGANDYPIDGKLDEIKVYNYARTAAQVAYDYNRGAPVGWWKLDECQGSTINDTSGKGNNGTLTVTASGGNTNGIGTCNTSTSAWGSGATGKFNASLFFDGNGDYVNVSDNGELNISGNYSASVWIKTSTSSQNNFAGIFAKTKDGTSSAYILQNDFGTLKINHDGAANFSTGITVASIADNVWHNIAYTYSGTTITVYLDGKQTLQGTYATPEGSGAGAMYIGAERTLTNWWNGQIDDLKIFNYALSLSQIQKLYNGGASVNFGPASGQP